MALAQNAPSEKTAASASYTALSMSLSAYTAWVFFAFFLLQYSTRHPDVKFFPAQKFLDTERALARRLNTLDRYGIASARDNETLTAFRYGAELRVRIAFDNACLEYFVNFSVYLGTRAQYVYLSAN